jgi:hypothetical protein
LFFEHEQIEDVLHRKPKSPSPETLSTVRETAQIVFVNQQCIVDVGTHGELVERCERYQELVQR